MDEPGGGIGVRNQLLRRVAQDALDGRADVLDRGLRGEPAPDRIDRLQPHVRIAILQTLHKQRHVALVPELRERLQCFAAHALVSIAARADQSIAAHVWRQPVLEPVHSLQANISIPIA